MIVLDLPPQLHERVTCSISAAAKFGVPANVMLAVAEQEGGKPGQWVRNSNGTHDVGPLQFNTAYLVEMARYGIKPADVAAAGCYPYELAAWRLKQHLTKDQGDLWTKVANYHSRTPAYNAAYRARLVEKGARWAGWLEGRFPITAVAAPAAAPVRISNTVSPAALAAVAAAARAPLKRGSFNASSSNFFPRAIQGSD